MREADCVEEAINGLWHITAGPVEYDGVTPWVPIVCGLRADLIEREGIATARIWRRLPTCERCILHADDIEGESMDDPSGEDIAARLPEGVAVLGTTLDGYPIIAKRDLPEGWRWAPLGTTSREEYASWRKAPSYITPTALVLIVRPPEDDKAAPADTFLADLRRANLARFERSRSDGVERWSTADFSNSLLVAIGAIGETVNGLRRHDTSSDVAGVPSADALEGSLAGAIADTIVILDLLASRADIDLQQAIIDSFNAVSERLAVPERLGGGS